MNTARVLRLFLTIIIPLIIILGNFRLVIFDKELYKKLQLQSGVYQNFPSIQDVNNRTDNLIGFYRSQNELDYNLYSFQAKKHLIDVKSLFTFSNNLLYLTFFVFAIGASIFIVKRKTINLFMAMQSSAAITLIFFLLLGLGVLNYFEPLFTLFHKMIFKNDLWLFQPDDTLINLFPQQFFILFSLKIAVNIVITCVFLILMSYFFKRRILNAHKRN